MSNEWNSVALDNLGVLRVRGADRVSFLQGQLSNDVTLLSAARALLAGYHNPQGRVIALLRLVEDVPDEVLAILPRELIATVTARLAKFILRAKVQLTDESAHWGITGLIAPEAPAGAQAPLDGALPQSSDSVVRFGDSIVVQFGAHPARYLVLSPELGALPPELSRCRPAVPLLWRRLMVAAGEPEVYAATSEEFVAQMLNLDVVGAIAFDKGCYTGQEVIARAHYRGRVKRRLQRFRTDAAVQLKPGDSGELADGRLFKVVDAVPLAQGGCEFLAVAPLLADEPRTPALEGTSGRTAQVINATELALPYELPE